MKIGFIGLGRMGKPMSINLVKAGYEVIVMSRSRLPIDELLSHGATEASNISDLTNNAKIICTCLPDEPASEEIYFGANGLLKHATHGQILVENSTIGPALARRIGIIAQKNQIGFLDAPISGGVPRATDGTLTIMAGGAKDSFEQALPILNSMGSTIHHVGAIGQGSVTKLTNQLLVGIHTLAACEAYLFGKSAGADPQQLFEVLGSSWGASNMLNRNAPMMISRNFGTLTPTRLLIKDLSLIEEVATELGISLPIGAKTRALFNAAHEKGLGDMDLSSLIQLFD